jgi:GTP 3',8-cyclase
MSHPVEMDRERAGATEGSICGPVAPASEGASLVDRFGRRHNYLRISVTDRCNFRCVYCMPAEGLQWRERDELLTYEEILRIARVFARAGVDKIRITGGEPTVRRNLEKLIAGLAAIPGIDSLLMTTNGFLLPEKAKVYRRAGLRGLNISLDTLRPDRFREITRTNHYPKVLQGIEAALEAGYESVKINVVVMEGVNDDELLDFVEFARERPINVRFIEFMPFQGNGWSQGKLVPYRAMLDQIAGRYEVRPLSMAPSAVAKEFGIEGFQGSIGFVTSMTENFCAGCNRLRLTAEGTVKNCLFSPDESDLRDFLRAGASDEELEQRIRGAVHRKWRGHPGMGTLPQVENRSMIRIGG